VLFAFMSGHIQDLIYGEESGRHARCDHLRPTLFHQRILMRGLCEDSAWPPCTGQS